MRSRRISTTQPTHQWTLCLFCLSYCSSSQDGAHRPPSASAFFLCPNTGPGWPTHNENTARTMRLKSKCQRACGKPGACEQVREIYSRALQAVEEALVLEVRAIISLAELLNPVYAASQYQNDGGSQPGKEHPLAAAESAARRRPHIADHVVGKHSDKEPDDNDLHHEAGLSKVETNIIVGFTDSRDGAAGGLQDQADDVERDENPPEPLGRDARDGAVEVVDAGTELELVGPQCKRSKAEVAGYGIRL